MSSNQAYPWFFFYRIARLSLIVFLPTLFLVLFFYRSTFKSALITQMGMQTKEDLRLIKHTLIHNHVDWLSWCQRLPSKDKVRFSIVKKDGTILCDSIKSKEGLTLNDMSEVNGAFDKEFFYQARRSDVFKTIAVFASLKIDEQRAIRKVVPISVLNDNLGTFDRDLFFKIVPFALLSYFLFIYLFFRSSKPLGVILSKVQKFKDDIPFNRSLDLLYKKDEWAQIEEALNKADEKLQDQVVQAKTENQKIAAILESIYDDIIAIDRYETVLFYNPNFKKNFIRERRDKEIIPRIWHTFSDEVVLGAFRSVLRNGDQVSLKALNFPTSHHPERYFDLTITPLKTSDGKINGALGVFYDVTEFKLTEQMRVDFVANVSHEIRTPLTSIKGYTQIMESQKQKIDPSLHLFLEKILSNTERMISLFNDLLNLSVIESQNALKIEEISLLSISEAISENIITNYPQKKIHISHELALEHIQGDRRLIEQVLSNLMDNACKYSGPELKIKISSFRKDNFAYISVADDGPGIPKEHLLRIFERFYRIEASREMSRGTGIGLSIVKHIVSKHKGRIWAESEGKHGTNFMIELPLE